MSNNPIDPAMDRMSVAPDPRAAEPGTPADRKASGQQADAGADQSIEERLARNPESKEARLDRGLDESMDASDPPASVQPIHNNSIPDSSGYDADAERAREEERPSRDNQSKDKGLIDKALSKLGLD